MSSAPDRYARQGALCVPIVSLGVGAAFQAWLAATAAAHGLAASSVRRPARSGVVTSTDGPAA